MFKKKFVFMLFIFIFLFASIAVVLAQTTQSNCAVVKIGNPKDQVSLPSSCSRNSSSGTVTECSGQVVSFGVEKKLLPFPEECPSSGGCGRKKTCFVPTKIVIHTTWGILSADGIYEYFASGSEGRGIGTHFVVGNDGKVLQMHESLSDKMEIGVGIANYNKQAISIEMGSRGNYESKSAAPAVQYSATLNLVKALMKQYNIPLGSLEYTWKSPNNSFNPEAGNGVYGHYQLNPETRSDPGVGFMRDFRNDLR